MHAYNIIVGKMNAYIFQVLILFFVYYNIIIISYPLKILVGKRTVYDLMDLTLE